MFKIAVSIFKLPDGSYFVLDVQDYSIYIFEKHGEKTNNLSVRTHVNNIENRITFEIKRECYLGY